MTSICIYSTLSNPQQGLSKHASRNILQLQGAIDLPAIVWLGNVVYSVVFDYEDYNSLTIIVVTVYTVMISYCDDLTAMQWSTVYTNKCNEYNCLFTGGNIHILIMT